MRTSDCGNAVKIRSDLLAGHLVILLTFKDIETCHNRWHSCIHSPLCSLFVYSTGSLNLSVFFILSYNNIFQPRFLLLMHA